MMMAILFPDAGELTVLGHRSARDAKDRIGYLPEERGVYRRMRVGSFLTFMARLKGVPDARVASRVKGSLERVGLHGTERKRCDELSKGMQQKVQLAAAILHAPDLLILDEPFSGLDPVSRRQLRDLILEEHRRGATVLFSTHVMPQAEEICQHVVMIHEGRKVLDEPLTTIRRRYDPRTIRFDPLHPEIDPTRSLEQVAGVERVERVDGGFDIRLAAGTDPGSAIQRITAAVAPARVEIARPRLEDVFIQIVSEGGASIDGITAAPTDPLVPTAAR
jgi:ABC-2 type transport system ATP-binding protein